ncbi:MAG: bacterial Ig-like domain-containing protein [Clostridia bacterium]|nr:bacterial Ig-like domain-containing protein [Clostridia bacterium]
MKKSLSLVLLLMLTLSIILTGCIRGQKEVSNIIVHNLKTEYELNEAPDFSGVTATIVYNDESTKEVDGSELTFGNLDTSVAGKKTLEISYEGYTTSVQITVKDKSIDTVTRELVSISYFSGLPSTIYVGATLNYSQIKIIANYSDGTSEILDSSVNHNIKINADQVNTAAAGTYNLHITYTNKSVDVPVVVNEIILTGIEIDGDTVDTLIVEGTAFDPTGMMVYALYNNGSRLAINLEDLTIEQNGNTVVVSYQGKTATLRLSTEPASITSMTITATGNEDRIIVIGDKISTAMVKATASYNNGTSKTIHAADLSFDIPAITAAGTYTITATYNLDASIKATYEVKVLGITSMTINATAALTKHPINTDYDTSKLTVLITCSDGSMVERSIADGVTVDSSAVKVDTVNPVVDNAAVPYYITASYGGSTSTPLGVVVYNPDEDFIIIAVDVPESIRTHESKKAQFLNPNQNYFVGDDNGFKFKLVLTILNASGQVVDGNFSYTSHFEILLDGAPADASYYTIDAKNNSVDFSDTAVDKTFTIKTRPANGVSGREAEMTRELTVTVVDGYNVYEAWELNYLTNRESVYQSEFVPGEKTQKQIVDEYLAGSNKAPRPAHNLAGMVIHNDLIIQREDLPAEYFAGGERSNDLIDGTRVFYHVNYSPTGVFNFYGNHYTINSFNVPNVTEQGTYGNGDGVSQSSLFGFAGPVVVAEDDPYRQMYENFTTNIHDLYLRDNHPNKDDVFTADRDKRGLIGIKSLFQTVNFNDVNVEAFYISLAIDSDFTVVNLDHSKLYNSWQNHIYIFSSNEIANHFLGEGCIYVDPANVYTPATLNITNSKVTKCGGPVIIAQQKYAEYACGSKSGAQVSIDANTEIWTYVTGEEAWFKSMGVDGTAAQLQGLAMLYRRDVNPTCSFSTQFDENGNTASGVTYMNIIMVNIASSTNPAEAMNGTTDLDGKLTIGGTAYLNMNDDKTSPSVAGGTVGYGDQNVANAIGAYAGKAPVLNTYAGGISVYNGTAWQSALTGDPTMDAMNKVALGMGDYAAFYMNNMGFVFGYNYAE